MKIEDVAEWYFVADDDYDVAKYLNDTYKPNNEIIYYHYARSIEKYLKGFLTYNNVKFPKNHNISIAIKQCIEYDKEFEQIKNDCNIIFGISNKLGYPKATSISNDDVSYILKSVEKTRNLKPIKQLRGLIIEKYGNDWTEILFNAQKPEPTEPMSCIKYDNFLTNLSHQYFNDLKDLKEESNITNEITKLTYNDGENNKMFLLKKQNSDGKTQLWHFYGDFNNSSAYEFIKQFNKLNNSENN